ncbi:hypothetical protein [Photorhabdus australis]
MSVPLCFYSDIPVIFQVASLLAALTHPSLYPSSFKLLLCWLRSLTPVT